MITDHKVILSALRNNRANKTYQSRLVRWVDKLLPFDFTVNHLAGKEMGMTDYLSREASGEPEPVSNYDEKFVVASIKNFFSACNTIKPNCDKPKTTSKTQKPKKALFIKPVRSKKTSMFRPTAPNLDKTKSTNDSAQHKDNTKHCTDTLINSLNKAIITESDADYIEVARNLQKLCSAVTPDKLNCADLKECSKLLNKAKSRSISNEIAKRHLVVILLRISRLFRQTFCENFGENLNSFDSSKFFKNLKSPLLERELKMSDPNNRSSSSVPPPNISHSPLPQQTPPRQPVPSQRCPPPGMMQAFHQWYFQQQQFGYQNQQMPMYLYGYEAPATTI